MSTKDTDSCLKKVGRYEPIFVLRAQDVTAPEIIECWIRKNKANASPKKLEEAQDCADAMRAWPTRRRAD